MVDIVDLRNLVAEAEGTTDERAAQENFASGYDVPFAYGQYLQPSKPISQMTFQELRDFQRRQVNATKGTFDNTDLGTSAVGRYQFIGPTLENLKNRLGYKDTDVFSPEVQDRLFDALMEEQGLQELSAGLITPEEFQTKLSSQFASIPKPGTETGTYKGQNTGVTSDRVSAVLSSMQADTQTDQMLSEEQPGGTFRPEDDSVSSDTGAANGDQAEEEPGFLDTVGEYVSDAYDTVSEYAGETVNTLERVAESVGEKLRRLLGSEEEQSNTSVDNPPIPEPRPNKLGQPPIPQPRPNQTKTPSFNVADAARDVYSLATTGSRASARKLRDMVAQQLGVYESSQEATSEAKKYGLNEREVDTLRHILGAGLLKYIGKDFTQPLLQGTELFEKIPIYAQRFLDPDSEDKYRKSYYDQSIEEANIDIVNYQVGAALAKQYDTKDDFIKASVQLVKDLGKGKTPVVLDKMLTRFGVVDTELTPRLSTGVVYPPEELKRRNLIYDSNIGTLTPPPLEDYGFVEPAPGSTLEDQGPAILEKAEGGSVEKEVEFVKEDDDDDVPDPPPGATPEEVADDIPAYLSTGEYVLPANVVRYIGLKNITDMHQRALAELQQMEDLDIIENVDENGYVEEDDDEMNYMKPEGVVEIVVAEHHPKGLMAMGFAEGGPVEAMVYVPGVGFVPQIQAATRSSSKKTSDDTEEETKEGTSGLGDRDTGKSMSEMSPMEQAAFGEALSGPLGGAIEAVSKGVVGGALGLASPLGVERGYSLATGTPTAAQQAMKSVDRDIAKAKEMYAMSAADLAHAQSNFSGPIGNPFGATQNQIDRHADAVDRGTAPAGSHANAAGGYSTTGEFGFSTDSYGDVVGNDPDRNGVPGDQSSGTSGTSDTSGTSGTSGTSDTSSDPDSTSGHENYRDGGYVSKKGIMAKGFAEGGDPGDPGGGMGEPLEPKPEVVEEEEPTDPYEGYTYVKGIGYVPTSRRMTSDKPVDSTSLALSSIFTPGFLETIGLMSDPNKEL